MKNVFILGVMILSCYVINAQNKITGTITDQDHLPLAGAIITLPEMNKGTISDTNGYYQFMNLPNGKIKVQFSFIGFASQIETVTLTGKTIELNTALKQSVI